MRIRKKKQPLSSEEVQNIQKKFREAKLYNDDDALREMALCPHSYYFRNNMITVDVMLSIMARKILALEASLKEDVDALVGGTE